MTFLPLNYRVVARLARRLQFAVYERLPIAAMRRPMIGDRGFRDSAFGLAPFAKRRVAKLIEAADVPRLQLVPVAPRRRRPPVRVIGSTPLDWRGPGRPEGARHFRHLGIQSRMRDRSSESTT